MTDLPAPSNKPTPDEIVSLVLSYSDPTLISMVLEQYGWSANTEIFETLKVARQDVNLGAKMTAIRHLRKLIRDVAEDAGMIAKVSQTAQGPDGTQTTFSAKAMRLALNPRRKIESVQKETTDDRTERNTTDDGGSTGETTGDGAGDGRSGTGTVDRRDDSGGTSGGGTDGAVGGPARSDSDDRSEFDPERGIMSRDSSYDDYNESGNDNSGIDEFDTAGECVDWKPPTSRRDLYPGVSG